MAKITSFCGRFLGILEPILAQLRLKMGTPTHNTVRQSNPLYWDFTNTPTKQRPYALARHKLLFYFLHIYPRLSGPARNNR